MPTLEVEVVPALSDNYVYILHDTSSGATAIVDPPEADPVLAALEQRGWKPTHILNTHHHADHTAANEELKERFGIPIIGPRADAQRIPGIDQQVAEGDTVTIGNLKAQVFDTPGHTSGHISFWFKDDNALFPGDTLFSLGCGRMFEGTPPQFWDSLKKLRALPDETAIYCGHEYTASNAKFALSIDGDNPVLKRRADEIARLRQAGQRTIPSNLGEEKAANPFLRADDQQLAGQLGMAGADPVEVFAEIRTRKDNF